MQKKITTIIIAFACCLTLCGQGTNTLYFMEEATSERLMQNPAFVPECKSYFDFILLPHIDLKAGENFLTVSDIVYSQNGKTVNAFSNEKTLDKLYKRMTSRTPRENFRFRLNILNFGVQVKPKHYFIFEMNLVADESLYLPKGMFDFLLHGMPDADGINSFDFKTLGVYTDLYASLGLGYSGYLSKKVTFGAKAKFLAGLANISTDIKSLSLDASRENWTLNSEAFVRAATAVPIEFQTTTDGRIDFKQKMTPHFDQIKPAGYGAAIDLGVTYEPIPYLKLSAAVTDLGMIHWTKQMNIKGSINGQYTIDRIIEDYSLGDTAGIQTSKQIKEFGDKISQDVKVEESDAYNTMLNAKFNAGIEYGILKNKISFGIVNQLTFNNYHVYDEVTVAVNFRPSKYFKAAVSYSCLDGRLGTLGLGLNLNLGALTMFIAADYIPITWTRVTSQEKNLNMPMPDRLQTFNLQAGMSFNIHRFARDKDRDGVYDKNDHCEDTDMDMLRSKCKKTKDKDIVDRDGCPYDTDNDGVADCADKCPGTPEGALVDECGCTIDTDNDGIDDNNDKCPDTPEGVEVDSQGCPLDEDNDGVPDYLDQCKNTPNGVEVDTTGCPYDTDRDGVPDYLDQCPETPEGVAVNDKGCAMDEDLDGVPDFRDQCHDTPRGVIVDENGCPLDRDDDGVPDYLDQCPDEQGPASNNGCPELTEVRELFKKAMTGIQFETGKATIKKSSYGILNKIAEMLSIDNSYNLEINGHTDNVGDPEKNLNLSRERAESVRNYLIGRGIAAERLKSEGYGDTQPIADNSTKKGREQNRRVEFNIVYEKISYQ